MNDYGDDSPVSSRSEAFGDGLTHSAVITSPGLAATAAARFNSSVPRNYRPTGSPSGMSANQNDATMGGRLPVQNGSAEDTYSTKKWFGDGNA